MSQIVFAAKCLNCGKISYPNHFYCPACSHKAFESVEVKGDGTIITFTRVYNLASDYVLRYLTIGIVEMDMGIRALGHFDIDEPEIGMRVSSRVDVVRNQRGKDINGLVFSKATK